jgi:hypothetical protein
MVLTLIDDLSDECLCCTNIIVHILLFKIHFLYVKTFVITLYICQLNMHIKL